MSEIKVLWDALEPAAPVIVNNIWAFDIIAEALKIKSDDVARIAARFYAGEGLLTTKDSINGANSAAYGAHLIRFVGGARGMPMPYVGDDGVVSRLGHYTISDTGSFLLPRLCYARKLECPAPHANLGSPAALWVEAAEVWARVGKQLLEACVGARYAVSASTVTKYRGCIEFNYTQDAQVEGPRFEVRSRYDSVISLFGSSHHVSIAPGPRNLAIELRLDDADRIHPALLRGVPELVDVYHRMRKRHGKI